MATGVVKWFNVDKGYGFITTDDGGDIYVHYTEVLGASALREGEQVEFEIAPGTRGPQAQQVRRRGQDETSGE